MKTFLITAGFLLCSISLSAQANFIGGAGISIIDQKPSGFFSAGFNVQVYKVLAIEPRMLINTSSDQPCMFGMLITYNCVQVDAGIGVVYSVQSLDKTNSLNLKSQNGFKPDAFVRVSPFSEEGWLKGTYFGVEYTMKQQVSFTVGVKSPL